MNFLLRTTFRAFTHRNYKLFWTGHAISLIGSWMQTLAQGWLVWRLTHSPFWLGVASAMSQLPSLLLGSVGGVIVDRSRKRLVLFITQSGLAITAMLLAILTFFEIIRVEVVVFLAAVSGIFAAIDAPARLSFVQDLVGKEDVGNAVAINSTTFNAARLVGPSIAGILVPYIGEAGCFFLNSISYAALLFTLSLMTNLPKPIPNHHNSFREQWLEAFQYVQHSQLHRLILLNTAAFGSFAFAYTVLAPAFAGKVLNIGVQGLGLLMGTVGAGALTGGLTLASFPRNTPRGKIIRVSGFILSLVVFIFSISKIIPLSFVMLFLIGFSGIFLLASSNTVLQLHTPDHLRGRVLGLYTTCFLGVSPIGHFLVGSLAERIGIQTALALVSGLCFLIALFTLGRNQALRKV
ncbi:MAG: MFS transporter [bacterium]|nr:MFS transporter [bacterium]